MRQLSSRSRESRGARRPRRRKGRLAFAAAAATLLTLTACGTPTDASVGAEQSGLQDQAACPSDADACIFSDYQAQFFDRPGHLSGDSKGYTYSTEKITRGEPYRGTWPSPWNSDVPGNGPNFEGALRSYDRTSWGCSIWYTTCVSASAYYTPPSPLPGDPVSSSVCTPGITDGCPGDTPSCDGGKYTVCSMTSGDNPYWPAWHINNRPVNVVVKPWESTPTPEMPTVARVDVINKDVKGAVTAVVDPNAQGEDVDGTQRFGFYQPVESAKAGTTGITITWEDGTYGTNYARIAMDSDTGQLDASAGCPGGQKISCHVLIDQAGLGEGPVTITVQPQLG